jgi:hypothetical protein
VSDPVEMRVIVNWMSDHGYRDLVPRRDPSFPTWLTYYFVQDDVLFTRSERNKLEQESARQGFRGIGDLIRAEMIRRVGSGSR